MVATSVKETGMIASNEPLPGGTKVLNTDDGEPGTIVNGFARDAATGAWLEYEVETAYGIERWTRERFVLLIDIEEPQNG